MRTNERVERSGRGAAEENFAKLEGVGQDSNQTVHGTDSASQRCVAKQGGKVSRATPKSRKLDVLVLHSSCPKKSGRRLRTKAGFRRIVCASGEGSTCFVTGLYLIGYHPGPAFCKVGSTRNRGFTLQFRSKRN